MNACFIVSVVGIIRSGGIFVSIRNTDWGTKILEHLKNSKKMQTPLTSSVPCTMPFVNIWLQETILHGSGTHSSGLRALGSVNSLYSGAFSEAMEVLWGVSFTLVFLYGSLKLKY